jgi:alpha-beta hydrolase superfamily lysophospholipase
MPRTHIFPGEGGVEIHAKWWPAKRTRGSVVIAHGGGEHSGRYQHVAERLNKERFAVFALDHRGHGQSGGTPGLIDSLDKTVADLGTLIGLADDELPDKNLFLLGHSTGGLIALEYALDRQDTLDGLALSAPLAKLEAASPVQLAAARVVSAVAPATGVFKVESSTVSRDPEVVHAYDDDPLVFHDKLPARTITEIAAAVKRFPDRLPGLRVPLLVMAGTADKLVPPEAATMVHDLAGSKDKTLIEYEGLYHEILNEPEQDEVLDDLVEWLKST